MIKSFKHKGLERFYKLSLMKMFNPPHPGEFINEIYLSPIRISKREVAAKLSVAPSTFHRLINGQSNVSSEMALRLSKTLGRSAESWLIMQNNYDLWVARQKVDLDQVKKLEVA